MKIENYHIMGDFIKYYIEVTESTKPNYFFIVLRESELNNDYPITSENIPKKVFNKQIKIGLHAINNKISSFLGRELINIQKMFLTGEIDDSYSLIDNPQNRLLLEKIFNMYKNLLYISIYLLPDSSFE